MRAARGFLLDAVGEAYDAACAADLLTVEHRTNVRLAAANAAATSAAVVDTAYNAGGGTSVYESSPLQRCFRDVHTGTQHVLVSPSVLEPLGRILLGIDEDNPLL